MEPLSLVLSTKMVADDVRRSVGGYDEVRRTAAEAQRVQRRRPRARLRPRANRLWSALWRSVTTRITRRSSTAKEVVKGPQVVPQSSGDCNQL